MTLKKINRRKFIELAGFAAAATSFSAASYARIPGANERLRIGFVGAGGMGCLHLKAIAGLKEKNNLEAVAVADCWRQRAEAGAHLVGAPQAYQESQRLLDRQDIDYVTVATPEHAHAHITLAALDAGKAVYCEKPLTHTIAEAKSVATKQAATQLPVQVGVQGMSDDTYSSAYTAIKGGIIGQVVQAQIEYVRRYGPQGLFRDPKINGQTPQPSDLDWNAWLGPAAKLAWNPHHYYEWRNFSAYSGGIATDLFIHRLSRVMRACGLRIPRRVVGMGGIWHWREHRDLPDNFEMICEYPEGMTVYVLGTQSNRVGLEHAIRGYRGTLYFTDDGWEAKDKDDQLLAKHTKTGDEDIALHHTNLHNHIRSGEALNCPVDFALAGVAACVMANESWRSGRMMGWDDESQDMVSCDQRKHDPFPATKS